MPKVSVLMSVYKEPIEWMKLSIDSILKQTLRDFEFIIINDNPTRLNNKRLLKDYAQNDSRIIVLENVENIGLTRSLNKALSIATGEYIARMDADDISSPRRLEHQCRFLDENPETIVLGTQYQYIGKRLPKKNPYIKYDDASIRAQMLLVNCIPHPTTMIRKSVLDKYNIMYDESYKHSQDFRLWEMLLPYGKFACLKECLLLYRMSDQQISTKNRNTQKVYADAVRGRLQTKWLTSIGCNVDAKILEEDPMQILKQVRKIKNINKSLEYKAFLQYCYLHSDPSLWELTNFFKKDMCYFSICSSIKLILSKLKKIAKLR